MLQNYKHQESNEDEDQVCVQGRRDNNMYDETEEHPSRSRGRDKNVVDKCCTTN